MILRRLAESLRTQNWTTVTVEFFVVVIGIFVGIEVSNWNEARKNQESGVQYRARLVDDGRADIATVQRLIQYYEKVKSHGEAVIAALTSETTALDRDFLIDVDQASQIWEYRKPSETFDELIGLATRQVTDLHYMLDNYDRKLPSARAMLDLLAVKPGRKADKSGTPTTLTEHP